jgi:sugar (pentulose or hexulose) kinase
MNHALIFDIGKTNKKCLVFDEQYRIVLEKSTVLPETTDEDGDPCEDLSLLQQWLKETAAEVLSNPDLNIRAINATTYGASFVHLNAQKQPVAPLYNYLKPFPDDLKQQFLNTYGNEAAIAVETASPWLGHLNSSLQLYWLKHRRPRVFEQIRYSLHLPQYITALAGSRLSSLHIPPPEATSIGCHTMLWDFQQKTYHNWVKTEGLERLFANDEAAQNGQIFCGTGLHDSSSALIPYLACFKEPFVLISTGTWCISLNPFNDEPLTAEELAQDCLCYLTYEGTPVKAARYFGGHEHEEGTRQLARRYGVADDFYKDIHRSGPSALWIAYLKLMVQLVEKQIQSLQLALGNTPIKRIYVDGGFSNNIVYMSLLRQKLQHMEVYAAKVAQATAMGAALAIHDAWNTQPVQEDLIELRFER